VVVAVAAAVPPVVPVVLAVGVLVRRQRGALVLPTLAVAVVLVVLPLAVLVAQVLLFSNTLTT
jgi:hypothetical protein